MAIQGSCPETPTPVYLLFLSKINRQMSSIFVYIFIQLKSVCKASNVRPSCNVFLQFYKPLQSVEIAVLMQWLSSRPGNA